MSDRHVVDTLRFASQGDSLDGILPGASLGRLAGLLAGEPGPVRFQLRGVSECGRPALRLRVEAVLSLVCQRCLSPYAQTVKIDSVLPVAASEAELAAWEREDPLLDALVADKAMDVAALVEDEILLGLPVVPRHADGACAARD